MAKEQLRYDRMVETALRGVVREAMKEVAERGLPGNHHFYLTFRSSYPGVEIPDYLRAQYPNEMTIVLQFQFYGLEVEDDGFAVTLSFNNVHERLVIPYAAITTFADPSVNFALQFQPTAPAESVESAEIAALPSRPADAAEAKPKIVKSDAKAEKGSDEEPKRGEVVTLDAFRKK
ncbi:SspB family protein [Azospirillum sp.]|uniref:SspB family protein n=1 Tax=Azospirillum sp. TaxID=34012 RepID=UPI002D616089|nr:ClpXP protease specificity-enhancing factor SspB [Azospirillum sp.]HYD69543.1 ClpXP protease specificity-enhancing factor SspB [Azospirillum sp.]